MFNIITYYKMKKEKYDSQLLHKLDVLGFICNKLIMSLVKDGSEGWIFKDGETVPADSCPLEMFTESPSVLIKTSESVEITLDRYDDSDTGYFRFINPDEDCRVSDIGFLEYDSAGDLPYATFFNPRDCVDEIECYVIGKGKLKKYVTAIETAIKEKIYPNVGIDYLLEIVDALAPANSQSYGLVENSWGYLYKRASEAVAVHRMSLALDEIKKLINKFKSLDNILKDKKQTLTHNLIESINNRLNTPIMIEQLKYIRYMYFDVSGTNLIGHVYPAKKETKLSISYPYGENDVNIMEPVDIDVNTILLDTSILNDIIKQSEETL